MRSPSAGGNAGHRVGKGALTGWRWGGRYSGIMVNSVGRKSKDGSGAIMVMSACLAGGSAQSPGAQESAPRVPAGGVKVEIRKENGCFRLCRGGRPYFIKGAVYGETRTANSR